MPTKPYEDFFAVSLERFQQQADVTYKELTAAIDYPNHDLELEEKLPAQLLSAIVESDLSCEEKLLALTLCMGKWLLAHSTSSWSIGPIIPLDFQQGALIQLGYGIRSENSGRFIPLAGWALDLTSGDSVEKAVALLTATARQDAQNA